LRGGGDGWGVERLPNISAQEKLLEKNVQVGLGKNIDQMF